MPIDNSLMEDFEKPLKHSNFLQLQMEMQKSISKILDFYFICQNLKKGPIYLALKSKFLFFPFFRTCSSSQSIAQILHGQNSISL